MRGQSADLVIIDDNPRNEPLSADMIMRIWEMIRTAPPQIRVDSPPLEYAWTPIRMSDLMSGDASGVRFSKMSAEAEQEMHEWDAIISGKAKK